MLSELDWLRPTPADFRDQLRTLRAELPGGGQAVVERLIALATHRLDESQLGRLATAAASIEGDPQPLSRMTLGIVGDGTLSLLGPAIAGSLLRHGFLAEAVTGDYGSALQQATDPTSPLRTSDMDACLIVPDYRLSLGRPAPTADAAALEVDAAFARIEAIAQGIRPSVKGQIFVQTLPPPVEPLFGSLDRVEAGSLFAMVEALNARLAAWARSGAVILIDIARLAASVGYERWDEPRHWHASKLGFSPAMIPVYADVVARTIAVARGKAKKALVLDLDNTLWGGVIGDDGLDGIILGQGSSGGEAHLAIQQLALDLRQRGVVLAVCSKNEDDAARLPFREHPDMLLREDHIAVFQANWTDKASNLRAIAATLNIGVDALVFLDDNPAERTQVRRELPLVGVPELPDDPALYPRMLAAAGYFDAVAFSEEDRVRADLYKANAERAEMLASASDVGAYLRSLDMRCIIRPFDSVSRARVSQLINKSNQFNLTTRRYSEAEVAETEADPARHGIHVRLTDRFGDNGIISVIVADKNGTDWDIDTWLMSCRVLGRRIEDAVLAHLVAAAHAEGAKRIVGRYIPSAKNRMVEGHYAKLGFALVEDLGEKGAVWALDIEDYAAPDLPMAVEDDALASKGVTA